MPQNWTARLPAWTGDLSTMQQVLAATLAEAEQAQKAVLRAGVTFAISFPHLGRPGIRAATFCCARRRT